MRPERTYKSALATARRSVWAVMLGLPAALQAQDVNLSDNLTNLSNATGGAFPTSAGPASGALAPSAMAAPSSPALIALPADWLSYAAVLIVLGVTAAYLLRKRY